MTGRAAAACALYAGFLASWALATAALRRQPSPYLLLGMALLEATLVLGALAGVTQLGGVGEGAAVHAGYLLASVLLAPLGLLFARDGGNRLHAAPLGVALLALAVVIVRVDATAG